jgi:glutathione-regulated potassium-efflux system ancillary protein KefG
MQRILLIFAHPALEKSRVNSVLLDAIRSVDGITVNDLYDRYPDFYIDVRHEQALLLDHNIIIFHHPFYWYSAPPLIKQWQDLVLEHGWAYGSKGKALHGKTTFNIISAGGGKQAYRKDGFNRFSIREFLAPFDQTAKLCGMTFLAPYVLHGTHRMEKDELLMHGRAVISLLESLRDEKLDLQQAFESEYLNDLLTGEF